MIPTDDIFIRLFKAYKYIKHFELSVPNENLVLVVHNGQHLKVTDRVTTRELFCRSLLRPSSGSEEGGLWLAFHRGELEGSNVPSSTVMGSLSGRSLRCGGRGLVLPPDGAPRPGNLDNAKDL